MYTARDLLLARRANKAGAEHSLRIILEARNAGLPLSLAFALVKHESNFKNIFGCDAGAPFCHQPVIESKIRELLASYTISNGVGLTQLTYKPFIRRADAMPGGAVKVKNQLRVGFQDLAHLVHQHGEKDALAIYNAGTADSSLGRRYARNVLKEQAKWHAVLDPSPRPRKVR